MKYCTYCGKQIADDAKFCTHCGKALSQVVAKPASEAAPAPAKAETAAPAAPAPEAPKRKVIELPQKDVEAFNSAVAKVKGKTEAVRNAAAKISAAEEKKAAEPKLSKAEKKAAEPKPAKEKKAAEPKAVKPEKQAADTVQDLKKIASKMQDAIPASQEAGEVPTGEAFDISGEVLKNFKGEAEKALSPVRAIFKTIGSFFGGVFGIFRKPKNLILVLIAVAVWVVLWLLRDSDSQIVKILSFLTFANVGEGRDVAGLVGTAFGKGTVAAFWVSLFSGGIPALFRGLGGMIKGTGEKRSIVNLIIGAVIGAALYFAYASIQFASAGTAMAGIAGAVLALQSIGRKSGPLYSLAQAFSSKVENGVRGAQSGKAQSFLSGLFLGFAIATVLMVLIRKQG